MVDEIQSQASESIRIGSKVRVKNFPPPATAHGFDWNGLVGIVVNKSRTEGMIGLNGKPIYTYDVLFKNVEVPKRKLNASTRKLESYSVISDGRNFFEEEYLELVP